MNTPDQGQERRFDPERIVFWGILVLFVVVRLWVTMTGRIFFDSDEGVVGIITLETLRGDPAVFFHGQDYMGNLQPLLSAPFVVLFGANPLALRLCAIIEGLAILVIWRYILRAWKIPGAWYGFALLLAIPPQVSMLYTMKFRGLLQVLLPGSVLMALLTSMALAGKPFEAQIKRWVLLGAVAALCWWSTQLCVVLLIPAVIWFLGSRRNFQESFAWLRSGPIPVTIVIVYLASLILLILRGSLSYKTDLSQWLYQWRWVMVGFHLLVLAVYVGFIQRLHLPKWILAFGVAFLIVYTPALTVFFSKSILYNTTDPGGLSEIATNLESFVYIVGGSIVGLETEALRGLGFPTWVLVTIPLCYVMMFLLLAYNAIREGRLKPDLPVPEVFLLAAGPGGFLLVAYLLQTVNAFPHYLTVPLFFVYLAFGWMFQQLGRIHWIIPVPIVLLMLSVHLYGLKKLYAEPVNPWTAVPTDVSELAAFLNAEGIDVAATCLDSSPSGYWEAYRISYSTGESLIVHPMLHMPRVDRYRLRLMEAEKIAIVSMNTSNEETTFQEASIPYKKKTFGTLEVLYDFDKAEVERQKLIDYSKSFDEPATD